jgi:bifunctional enzyme CysN/CysC/sulfate adenylyltransferase subunit 1
VRALVTGLGFASVRFFPVSARAGDNVTAASPRTPWHTGGTVLGFLETVQVARDLQREPLRFPVQTVLRPHLDYRGYAGQLASGTVAVGDELVVLPSGVRTRVKAIDTFDGPLQRARAPQSVVLRLEGEVDAGRGDLLAHPHDAPQPRWELEATAVWLSEQPADLGRAYLVKHTTRTVPARIEAVRAVLDLETSTEHPAATLRLNELGKIALRLSRPLLSDPYARSRGTGALLIIDALTNQTVAAATVREDAAQARPKASSSAGLVVLVERGSDSAALADALLLERTLAERGRPAALVFSAEAAVAVAAVQLVALVPVADKARAAALRTAALGAGARVAEAKSGAPVEAL